MWGSRKNQESSANALYTHCNSHILNLSIASACKLPVVRNMIGTINETFLFFHNSPKRFLEQVLEMCSCTSKKAKFKGLCKTRWVERHECYETFYEFYKYTCISLEAIIDKNSHLRVYHPLDFVWDKETAIKAQGLFIGKPGESWMDFHISHSQKLPGNCQTNCSQAAKEWPRCIYHVFDDW